MIKQAFSLLTLLLLVACGPTGQPKPPVTADSTPPLVEIKHETMVLDNGLTVILHQDTSDPIVAFSTIVHVGSSREKKGRTGFAHFFEHMSFNDSENVPMGANRKMIPELGGTRNGGTWSDGTIYYEVVPKDAFEKLMWIDSDRFGYMINTVKEATLEREKQVVKNEKRQRVDNRPYGHTSHVIKKALYPEEHPYNWTVIGDLEDLQNATLADVREFYDRYYTPANATLVIAGDIDIEATKASVKRWFGEIKAGPAVPDMAPMPVTLRESKNLYHLDNFAQLPELRLTFPTVEQYHPDAYALDALGEILSYGKQSPLFTTLVEGEKLSSNVAAYNSSEELAGTFTIRVRANAGVDLDAVKLAIQTALDKFETEGIRAQALTKIKARQETNFYNGISSVLNKAYQLGLYQEFAGDPDYYLTDIQNIKAVTQADVLRVYEQYIKNRPHIMTSFVPKAQPDLIVDGSSQAPVVEEAIVQGKEKEFVEDPNAEYVKTPTQHDRSEPPLGELPVMRSPAIWQAQTPQGMAVYGVEHREVPLVNFSLRIEGGQALDASDKQGTAALLAAMLNEGTALKTPAELEDAIGLLGSSISVTASHTGITVSGSSLARNFAATIDLMTEMLLQPRFDEADFERVKTRRLASIESSKGNPNTIANEVFMQLLYGEDHVAGQILGGDQTNVQRISLADVTQWYQQHFSAQGAQFHVAGAVSAAEVTMALAALDRQWSRQAVTMPDLTVAEQDHPQRLFFIDFPGAKQSVLMVGKTALDAMHEDFHRLEIVNNRLGTGSSARLTQTLRINKGYTYGAYSYIQSRKHYPGAFVAATQVRTNVTLESLQIVQQLIGEYAATFAAEDLATTQNLLRKGNTRRFETLGQLLGEVTQFSRYQWPTDYLEQEQAQLAAMDLEQAHALINTHLHEPDMIYLVVGDAETQLERVKQMGLGDPVMLDKAGQPLP
ncbi:M16 family metallopeptidase [Marinicella meishanensis]|uniref:M16 family metallopeptidase n=1 Tax=Marinicella meishanensis TaxID=2873263 RepID=UPI001CBBD7DB|nr:pitrilysin family protein [Marinicella sp. NBU2979]